MTDAPAGDTTATTGSPSATAGDRTATADFTAGSASSASSPTVGLPAGGRGSASSKSSVTERPVDPATQRVNAIRAATLAVPGVAKLHTGTFGEVATYLPGGKVEGIRSRSDGVEVHLVTKWESQVLQVAKAVQAAVSALPGMGGIPVRVVVQDITAPETPDTLNDRQADPA